HLLLALTDDPDALAMMRACDVDIEQLRRALDTSLANMAIVPVAKGEVDSTLAGEVSAVLQWAADQVRSVDREVVTGAHGLVEIPGLWAGLFPAGGGDAPIRRGALPQSGPRKGGDNSPRRGWQRIGALPGAVVERRLHADGIRRARAGAVFRQR